MNPIEVLVECGITYQPLTIGLQLLKNTHDIKRVHVLTTYSAYEGAMLLLEEFFPDLNVIFYGEFVDVGGRLEDQREYRANVASALNFARHPVIGWIGDLGAATDCSLGRVACDRHRWLRQDTTGTALAA